MNIDEHLQTVPLAFKVQGCEKFGYFVTIWDQGGEFAAIQLCSTHGALDWSSSEVAKAKAAEALRALASRIEAGEP